MYINILKKELKDNTLLVYIYCYARKMYTIPRRNGFEWTIPEILRLQREWELLQLSVSEIADLHERSMRAIMIKLEDEGFATYEEAQNRLLAINFDNLTITDNNQTDTCQKKKHVVPSFTKMTLRSHVTK